MPLLVEGHHHPAARPQHRGAVPGVARPQHWAAGFLGWPYERGAQGPALWDCWSFFRSVQRQRYGREISPLPSAPDWRAVASSSWAADIGWRSTDAPRDGDAVFMSKMNQATHVGTYVADLKSVLHCAEGSGSVLHDARHLVIAAWVVRAYYTPEV